MSYAKDLDCYAEKNISDVQLTEGTLSIRFEDNSILQFLGVRLLVPESVSTDSAGESTLHEIEFLPITPKHDKV